MCDLFCQKLQFIFDQIIIIFQSFFPHFRYNRPYQTRDVVMVTDLFGGSDDLTIYNNLLEEIENSGVDQNKLWQLVRPTVHLTNFQTKCFGHP